MEKSWKQTDDLQWVKIFNENQYSVITVSETPELTFILQHRDIDLSNYDEKEMEEQVSAFYNSLNELKSHGWNDNCHWKQIVAECIAEQEGFDFDDLVFETEEKLNEYLENEYGIVKKSDSVIETNKSSDPHFPGVWVRVNGRDLVLVEYDKEKKKHFVRVWTKDADENGEDPVAEIELDK